MTVKDRKKPRTKPKKRRRSPGPRRRANAALIEQIHNAIGHTAALNMLAQNIMNQVAMLIDLLERHQNNLRMSARRQNREKTP
jgi:hypothetical protein